MCESAQRRGARLGDGEVRAVPFVWGSPRWAESSPGQPPIDSAAHELAWENFLKAAHKVEGSYKGHRYDDTDTYKIIEAASYALAVAPDPTLDKKIDDLIAIVAAAQEPDGYLYAARTADPQHPALGAGPGDGAAADGGYGFPPGSVKDYDDGRPRH